VPFLAMGDPVEFAEIHKVQDTPLCEFEAHMTAAPPAKPSGFFVFEAFRRFGTVEKMDADRVLG
jgi:hypothetical protein